MMSTKRRKIALRAGIPLGVVIVVILAVSLVFVNKMRLEISQMAPLDSGEVISKVYAVKSNSYANFYLIQSGGNLVAFDSGANKRII